jgi:hypothetical protein
MFIKYLDKSHVGSFKGASRNKIASKKNFYIQLLIQVQENVLATYTENYKGAYYYHYYYEIGQLATQSTCRRGGGSTVTAMIRCM